MKNNDFGAESRPDVSKSSKINSFFTELLRNGAQNGAQNCDFSENPRWGAYKNHKNGVKNTLFFSIFALLLQSIVFRYVFFTRFLLCFCKEFRVKNTRKNDDFGMLF